MVDEVAESSRSRRMDLNLYLGLPPLPRPRGRDLGLDLALGCASPLSHLANSAEEGAIIRGPRRVFGLSEPAIYSPSNALSTPEPFPVDPLFAFFDNQGSDNEVQFDASQPVTLTFGASFPDVNLSVSLPPLPELLTHDVLPVLEGDDHEPRLHLSPTPSRIRLLDGEAVPPVGRVETVRLSELANHGGSDQGQPGEQIETAVPELRLRRLIQVSEQHQIVRSGPVNRRGTSPDTDRLIGAIMHSQSSLEASRKHVPDGNGKIGAAANHKKEGDCECGASFECNICFDTAKEPVVTPCGHLFCWPCLYQWLHAHSGHSECPVCKGEVFEVNVTPIYGRGGGERDASSCDIPPRPQANRSESLRQQLQRSDSRDIRSIMRRLAEEEILRARIEAHASPEVPGRFDAVHPAGRSRVRAQRHRREDRNALPSMPTIALQVGNATPEIANQVLLPSSGARHGARDTRLHVRSAPWASSSTDRASTSSTMAVIVGGDATPMEDVTEPTRRAGSSASTRRTRRRLH